MKEVSPALKSWVELTEKALIVLTLVIGLGVSVSNGIDYLGAKTQQAEALKDESVKRIEVLDRFADTYLAQLEAINADIRGLDEGLGKEIWKNSTGWDVKIAVRLEKTKDRQVLLQNLGEQILELKRLQTK